MKREALFPQYTVALFTIWAFASRAITKMILGQKLEPTGPLRRYGTWASDDWRIPSVVIVLFCFFL